MSEWMEMTWNNPMGMVLWSVESVPIKVTWDEWFDQTLSKWMDSLRNEWIEVNRVKWIEMSEWMELTWNNPMGKSLWSIESVPIKVTWCEWKWMSLSKWSESMRNEWNEVNRVKWSEMSDLMDLTLWTLWESPYESVESVPIKVTWDEWKSMSLSKWMESMRNEWNEVNRVKWGEMSEWMEMTWEWTLWESPYQNDQNRWEMNELKWIEVNRGKMSDLKDLMRSTLWEWSYGR